MIWRVWNFEPGGEDMMNRYIRDYGVRKTALLQIVGGDKLIIPFC